MSMDGYRAYLDGLDLTEDEKTHLIQDMVVVVTNIIDSLYKEYTDHDND
jgi:hypothetical protein